MCDLKIHWKDHIQYIHIICRRVTSQKTAFVRFNPELQNSSSLSSVWGVFKQACVLEKLLSVCQDLRCSASWSTETYCKYVDAEFESILAISGRPFMNLCVAANVVFGKDNSGCWTCVVTDVLIAECCVTALSLMYKFKRAYFCPWVVFIAVFYSTSFKMHTKKKTIGGPRDF